MKYLLITSILSIFTAFCSYSQGNSITIASKFDSIPNVDIEKLIEKNTLNYVDVLDYNVLKHLCTSLSLKYKINFLKIENSEREFVLDSTKYKSKADILVFSFSESQKRRNKGILFCQPYYVNKGIGLFSMSKRHNVESIYTSKVLVGVVENSTAHDELREISLKNKKLQIVSYHTFDSLAFNLESKNIDLAAGDISRFSYHVNANHKIEFIDFLPTRKSIQGDGVSVGIGVNTLNRQYLKVEIDKILLNRKDEISYIINKYLDLPVNYTLNKKNIGTSETNFWYILLLLFIFASLLGLLFKSFLQKPKRMELDSMQSMDDLAVCNQGINLFNDAVDEIIYVGSGGFMSEMNQRGIDWRGAVYEALYKKKNFIRIVDIPDIDYLLKSKIKDEDYLKKFYTWIVIQYLDMQRYPTLTLYDSRAASIWGVGCIMIFQDSKKVMIFTSSGSGKMGTVFEKEDLIASLTKDIKGIILDKNNFQLRSAENIYKEFFENSEIIKDLLIRLKPIVSVEKTLNLSVIKDIKESVESHVFSIMTNSKL